MNGLGQVGLPGGEGFGFIMSVPISIPMAHALHQLGGRIAQVHRDFVVRVLADVGHTPIEGVINSVALGRQGQVGHRLGQRQLPFWRPQAFLSVPGFHA